MPTRSYSLGVTRYPSSGRSTFWDAAAAASDQFERIAQTGEIRRSGFRTLWYSDPLPASGWVLKRSTPEPLRHAVRSCTESYRIPPDISKLLGGADKFVAIDAEKTFTPVRFVEEATTWRDTAARRAAAVRQGQSTQKATRYGSAGTRSTKRGLTLAGTAYMRRSESKTELAPL